jgi:hypothetical protein
MASFSQLGNVLHADGSLWQTSVTLYFGSLIRKSVVPHPDKVILTSSAKSFFITVDFRDWNMYYMTYRYLGQEL